MHHGTSEELVQRLVQQGTAVERRRPPSLVVRAPVLTLASVHSQAPLLHDRFIFTATVEHHPTPRVPPPALTAPREQPIRIRTTRVT